jgi:hypothetical protein
METLIMIGAQSGYDPAVVIAVYMGLLSFGIIFNLAVGYAETRTWMQGYVSLFVAAGVLVVLSALAVIDWRASLLAFGAFVFAGTPMILGSIYRHVREREHELEQMRRDARAENANTTQTLASRE